MLLGPRLTINFDTLALVKHLEKEGAFTRAQAESLAEGLESAVGAEIATKTDLKVLEHALQSDLKALEKALQSDLKALENALKSDVKALENALKSDITGLKSDMRTLETALRSDMKLEMQVLEKSLKLWAGGIAFALFGAISGVMTFLFRVFLH